MELSFRAIQEREFVFHLQCKVKNKPTPLVLNVKVEGYAANLSVSVCNPDGKEFTLPLDTAAGRSINFGEVRVCV